ncbi:MAG: GDYXXLXY domain-containing protein, partial [Bacteroidota bacterium]
MKNKWQLFFALVVLFQLAVPAKMIWDQEYVLAEGQSFRFKTRAYDPNDPFRGKYIRLAFEADILEGNYLSTEGWERGDQVCVWLENDADGFAKIQRI